MNYTDLVWAQKNRNIKYAIQCILKPKQNKTKNSTYIPRLTLHTHRYDAYLLQSN